MLSLSVIILYTGYTGYRFLFGTPPIEYGKVQVYGKDSDILSERFKEYLPPNIRRGGKKHHSPAPNLFVLRGNVLLEGVEGNIAPLPFIYADIWNSGDWYAVDFMKDIERRLFTGTCNKIR